MSVNGENYSKLVKLSSNHFHTANKTFCGESVAES